MDLGLEGKLVLVTGSTKGIGKAIATAFVRAGACVLVNGRTQGQVDEVVAELSSLARDNGVSGTVVLGVVADISHPEGARHLEASVAQAGRPLDVLVNNVGIFAARDFFECTDDEWAHYFNVNVMSAVRLSRAFMQGMLERGSGRILFLASEAGVKPLPHMIHYSVTKTAVIGLARGLAELTKGTGVTVNSVLAGPTWTEGVQQYMIGMAEKAGKPIEDVIRDYFAEVEPTSLLQRFIQPEEVANTVLFLASKPGAAINGSSQRVEGGIIRHI